MKKVILFSLAVAALASCSKENSPIEEGEKEIGTLSVAASFGISVEEENAFATKDVNSWNPSASDYTYYVCVDGTTTAASAPGAASVALTAWNAAEAPLELYVGTYDIYVGNVSPTYAIATDGIDLPTTALTGVKYRTNAIDATVAQNSNTDVSVVAEDWNMLNCVINVACTDDASATYFGGLTSYSVTVGTVTLADKSADAMEAKTGTISGNQGYFKPLTDYTVELKYNDGAADYTLTATTAVNINAGEEVTVLFSTYETTITMTVAAPDGSTQVITNINFDNILK